MKKISVVIVDDQEDDRYVAKRVLSKSEEFGKVIEVSAGDTFIEEYFAKDAIRDLSPRPVLVLMDVNMPRMNGFETVEEMQRYMEAGRGLDSIVVMMFTSSDNPDDRERAATLEAVKGYISKPIDSQGIETIRKIFSS